jgi:tetratricopeptide (TPR) repeat protein
MGLFDRLKKKPKSSFDIYGEEVMHEFVHNPDPVVLEMLIAEGKPPLPVVMGNFSTNFLDRSDGTSFTTTIKQYVEMKAKIQDKIIEEQADTPVGSWHIKGAKLSWSGNYEEAIKCFDKALELDPNIANSWDNRGNPFMKLKNYEEAFNCYTRALQLDPNRSNTWFKLGGVLVKQGEEEQILEHRGFLFREAIKCFDKVLELDPNDNDALAFRQDVVNRFDGYVP